jgi:hypothetical protein
MKKIKKSKKLIAYIGTGAASAALVGFLIIPNIPSSENVYRLSTEKTDIEHVEILEDEIPKVPHVETPEAVRAIYMSSCVAGTPSFRNDLLAVATSTEINSILIDIKDYSGKLSFRAPEGHYLEEYLSDRCYAPDMKEFIERLHENGIYVMGRVQVFQDDFYSRKHPDQAVLKESDGSIWTDGKGISFIDASSQKGHDHAIEIAKLSYAIGFDEINFDYIRFPSDGNMQDISFPLSGDRDKADVMEDFFAYVHEELKDTGVKTSADLFGMVTTNTDDLNIGQVLEKALPYFDYVSPMVYPSHFPTGFNGWGNPNKKTYEIIKFTMDSAVERTIATTTPVKTIGSTRIGTSTPAIYTKESYDKNKIRPWLQDFDYGGNYDIAEVKNQIQATYDSGLNSWYLWAPSNRYTIGALEQE